MSLSSIEIRRSLLGTATEEERSAVEEAYTTSEADFDQVGAEEELLIESYLDGGLESNDREQFERHYLASAHRRRRVDAMQRLMDAAARSNRPQHRLLTPLLWQRRSVWVGLGAAAAIVLAALLFRPARPTVPQVAERPSQPAPEVTPPSPTQPPPSVTPPETQPRPPAAFAFSLAPAAVRSGGNSPSLTIPSGIQTVLLRLEGYAATAPSGALRVTVSRVGGEDVWRGEGTRVTGTAGLLAQAEVPASVLEPNDYVVRLFRSASSQPEPLESYFLRVRR